MTSKEKAIYLVDKFLPFQTGTIDDMVLENFKESKLSNKPKIVAMMDFSKFYKAKQCAIICAKEIMKTDWYIPNLSAAIDWKIIYETRT